MKPDDKRGGLEGSGDTRRSPCAPKDSLSSSALPARQLVDQWLSKWRAELKRIGAINTAENRPRQFPELSVFIMLNELEAATQRDARSRASSGPERGDLGAAIRQLIERWRYRSDLAEKLHRNAELNRRERAELAGESRTSGLCANELKTALAALLDPAPPETNEEELTRRDTQAEPVVSGPPQRPLGD